MYVKNKEILRIGRYTAYEGCDEGGRRFWVEGPDVTGRLCPIAACFDVRRAVQIVRLYSSKDTIHEEYSNEDGNASTDAGA